MGKLFHTKNDDTGMICNTYPSPDYELEKREKEIGGGKQSQAIKYLVHGKRSPSYVPPTNF